MEIVFLEVIVEVRKINKIFVDEENKASCCVWSQVGHQAKGKRKKDLRGEREGSAKEVGGDQDKSVFSLVIRRRATNQYVSY